MSELFTHLERIDQVMKNHSGIVFTSKDLPFTKKKTKNKKIQTEVELCHQYTQTQFRTDEQDHGAMLGKLMF